MNKRSRKREVALTVTGVLGMVLVGLGAYVRPLDPLAWIGGPLVGISLYLAARDRQKRNRRASKPKEGEKYG